VEHGVDGGPGAALGALDELMLSSAPVEMFLAVTARLAARVVDPPAFCGITIRRDDHPMTVANSDNRAADVDETQYEFGEGPCLEAMRTGRVVGVDDVATETRWPRYIAQVASEHEIGSSLSLPLIVDSVSTGALNLYATSPHAFDTAQRGHAESFAAHASAALTMALREARHTRLDEDLRQALTSRSVIDQAIGALMAQQHCDADEAFALLRAASQHRNRKLRDLAAELVAGVGGAPARPGPFHPPTP